MAGMRTGRLQDVLQESNLAHVLLTSPTSLRYFAGHTTSIEIGPSPFTPLAGALVWVKGEEPVLFLAEGESREDVAAGLAVRSFPGYTYDRPLRSLEELTTMMVGCLGSEAGSKVGVEMADLPAIMLEGLRSKCRQLEFTDITPKLAEMRSIKDEDEVLAIRAAVELCDLGQATVRKWALPGMTELEVFAEMRKVMESAAGTRLPILADLVSGVRTAGVGGNPGPSKLEANGLVMADIVPRYKGYWGDTCNTCAVGEHSAEQRRIFQGIESALYETIDRVRPGVRACDLDSFLRQRVKALGGSYPHHSGHGIGLTFHEEPRIVPYNHAALQAGMVIAIEPGIYFEGKWGLRLEHTVFVTQTGAEILSKFKHAL